MAAARSLPGFLLFALLLACAPVLAQQVPSNEPDSTVWENYYPLALGNAWAYRVMIPATGKTSQIRWEVTSAKKDSSGRSVFQVVPAPLEPEDVRMEIRLSKSGVQEITDGTWVLKFPLHAGSKWSSFQYNERRKGMVSRSFRVVSAGRPCESAGRSYMDCIVLEEQNEELQWRVETLYARGTGPVKYTYWPLHSPDPAAKPVRVVELISFQVLPQQSIRQR
ncbi:MAG: hypothetical protein HY234_12890 [Acidobacteria bacterium]|nr:hypothetical protein [Acidobacteriota bacterium]MBI3663932.1 hypothetical protein [Acidobacteriota bacterium]